MSLSSIEPFPRSRPITAIAVGAGVAALYVVVALVCLFSTSSAHAFSDGNAERARAVGYVPYVVLALALLTVGLLARRWWQAPIAPLVLLAGGWWWLTWVRDFPQHVRDHGWPIDHANSVINALGTGWHVGATAVVVVGWGLVRRRGWWWTLGLVPSAVLIGLAEVVDHSIGPDERRSYGSTAEAVRHLSHILRVQGVTTILLTTAVVVVSVWICALLERRAQRPADVTTSEPVTPAWS